MPERVKQLSPRQRLLGASAALLAAFAALTGEAEAARDQRPVSPSDHGIMHDVDPNNVLADQQDTEAKAEKVARLKAFIDWFRDESPQGKTLALLPRTQFRKIIRIITDSVYAEIFENRDGVDFLANVESVSVLRSKIESVVLELPPEAQDSARAIPGKFQEAAKIWKDLIGDGVIK